MKKVTLAIIILIMFIPLSGNGLFNIEKNFNKEIKISYEYNIQNFISNDFHLIYPLTSNPVIVDKMQNFTILFNSSSFDDINVKIITSYNPIPDTFELKIKKIWHDNKWHVDVFIPDIPYELYNLSIETISNGETHILNEPRAVSIQKIDGNFTFIHLTDFHIGDPRGMKVNIKETIGWKAAKKAVEEINLLHPNFVVITGDLVFGQLYPMEYSFEYKKLYKILQKFDIPTFLCPGNHDGYIQCGQDGFKLWEKYFGKLYYSFDYGKAHFIMANSYDWPKKKRMAISYIPLNWGGYIGDDQLKWINDDLKNRNAKLKILCLHHNPLWDTKNDSLLGNEYYNRQKLLKIIWNNSIDIVLDGHVHFDDVENVNGTLFITTTTAASDLGSNDAYWGYRIIKIRNWSIFSYNYKEPKFSIPSYHINATIGRKEATIENNLDKEINAFISFCVENSSYEIQNGKIIMERRRGNRMELYIEATIPSNSKLTIRIK